MEWDQTVLIAYDDLLKRDKVNLDIFWLKDDSLEESANFPAPEVIAADIAADLGAARLGTVRDHRRGFQMMKRQ